MKPRRRLAQALVMILTIAGVQQVSRLALAAALDTDTRGSVGADLPASANGYGGASQVAPERLADTDLYEPGGLVVDPRNRAYSPQYPLWSDGATKARWMYLPPGTAIDATDVTAWDFPVGTRFWKEFAFNGRKIETRLLWRTSAARWVFASYVWNEQGTDATRAPDEGLPSVAAIAPGRSYSIPSIVECRACHDARRTEALGVNALQLSTDRDPHALHGEPLTPEMVTLRTLVDEGLLRPARRELVTAPPRIHASSPRTRAVLGYLAANCGICHNRDTDIAGLGPSLKHADVADGDAVARRLVGQRTAWQAPGAPEGTTMLIDPAAPDASAILTRMRSRRPSSQMPAIGTAVADRDAIAAIREWISVDVARRP